MPEQVTSPPADRQRTALRGLRLLVICRQVPDDPELVQCLSLTRMVARPAVDLQGVCQGGDRGRLVRQQARDHPKVYKCVGPRRLVVAFLGSHSRCTV